MILEKVHGQTSSVVLFHERRGRREREISTSYNSFFPFCPRHESSSAPEFALHQIWKNGFQIGFDTFETVQSEEWVSQLIPPSPLQFKFIPFASRSSKKSSTHSRRDGIIGKLIAGHVRMYIYRVFIKMCDTIPDIVYAYARFAHFFLQLQTISRSVNFLANLKWFHTQVSV